jgi:hypothetical protein
MTTIIERATGRYGNELRSGPIDALSMGRRAYASPAGAEDREVPNLDASRRHLQSTE